jgi:hypothetical protein
MSDVNWGGLMIVVNLDFKPISVDAIGVALQI